MSEPRHHGTHHHEGEARRHVSVTGGDHGRPPAYVGHPIVSQEASAVSPSMLDVHAAPPHSTGGGSHGHEAEAVQTRLVKVPSKSRRPSGTSRQATEEEGHHAKDGHHEKKDASFAFAPGGGRASDEGPGGDGAPARVPRHSSRRSTNGDKEAKRSRRKMKPQDLEEGAPIEGELALGDHEYRTQPPPAPPGEVVSQRAPGETVSVRQVEMVRYNDAYGNSTDTDADAEPHREQRVGFNSDLEAGDEMFREELERGSGVQRDTDRARGESSHSRGGKRDKSKKSSRKKKDREAARLEDRYNTPSPTQQEVHDGGTPKLHRRLSIASVHALGSSLTASLGKSFGEYPFGVPGAEHWQGGSDLDEQRSETGGLGRAASVAGSQVFSHAGESVVSSFHGNMSVANFTPLERVYMRAAARGDDRMRRRAERRLSMGGAGGHGEGSSIVGYPIEPKTPTTPFGGAAPSEAGTVASPTFAEEAEKEWLLMFETFLTMLKPTPLGEKHSRPFTYISTLMLASVYFFMAGQWQGYLLRRVGNIADSFPPSRAVARDLCQTINIASDTCLDPLFSSEGPKVMWNIVNFKAPFGDTFGSEFGPEYMIDWGARSSDKLIEAGESSRWFTSVLIHYSFSHLMGNLLFNYLLLLLLEGKYGWLRLTTLWCTAGLAGNFLSALVEDPCKVTAGASGALHGLFGVYVVDLFLYRKSLRYPLFRGCAVAVFVIYFLFGLADPG
mmetsp:Transcript_12040/g.38131  ORF Transcript_12040/g.38131 Transcript_12040/m.38131 type:complete len:727 (+) Transcript_12040:154-2334(+)